MPRSASGERHPCAPHPSLAPALDALDALEAHLSTVPPLRLHSELDAIIAGLRAVIVLTDEAFTTRLAQFSKRLDEAKPTL